MNGYDFITAVDDKKWGTVVDQQGDYVIVEHGTLRKHRYAGSEVSPWTSTRARRKFGRPSPAS